MREIDDQAGVADYLSVSGRTLEDWRYRGVGPAFTRAGKAVRYRKTDVDRWLDQNVRTPA